MIIGIEAERANMLQKTGVEHYAQQVIMHLAKIDTSNTYILYVRTKPQEWFLHLPKNFTVKVIPFPIFWTHFRISWEMLIHPVDVLFIPASALPIIHPKHSVITIHDIAWLLYPQTFTWFNRFFLKLSTWFAVTSASRVIAVSSATKRDIINYYGIAEKKVVVVHHGYNQEIQHKDSGKVDLPVPHKYVLFLSTLQPRKNLEGLITAFTELKAELPELEHKLVVVGKPGWKFKNIVKAIESHPESIVYLNHVSENDKAAILAHADALVLPSFYEGFGMQILEAFAAHVPVATSNISSMPEVAGEAAVYFDPRNSNQIKSALKSILLDKSLADTLRLRGVQRLQNFSWQTCAQETYNILTHD